MWRKNRVGYPLLARAFGHIVSDQKTFSELLLFFTKTKQFPIKKHLHIFKNLYQPERVGPLINWSWQMLAFFTCTLKSIVVIDSYLISSFHCLRHLRKQVPSIDISASYSFSSAITTNSYVSWGTKLKAKKFGQVWVCCNKYFRETKRVLKCFYYDRCIPIFGEKLWSSSNTFTNLQYLPG